MTDQTPPPDQPTTAPASTSPPDTASAPPLDAVRAQYEAQLAEAQARLRAYEQTLAALQQQQQPAAGMADPQLVTMLRQQGFTAEEIEQNTRILRPYLDYYGNQIAQALLAQQAELQYLRASRNRREFPHWEALEPYIEREREAAQRAGRWIDPKVAYALALAAHPDAVRTEPSPGARDAIANTTQPSSRTPAAPPPTPKTEAEILSLSPEERAKLWDELANTPF